MKQQFYYSSIWHLLTQAKKNSGLHQTQTSHVPVKNDNLCRLRMTIKYRGWWDHLKFVFSLHSLTLWAKCITDKWYYESYDVNCDVKCITFMQNSVLSADRTPDEHEHCCWTPGYAEGRESMLCKAHDHVPIWQSQTVEWNSLQAAQCLPTDVWQSMPTTVQIGQSMSVIPLRTLITLAGK